MGNMFFNEYPYTDFHELNLSWVIKELRSFATTLEQFVSINALKYADPIQWNITTQYEKNTIVIDPQSGTAYISVQPVPAGVALNNTDYWTVVFDLEQFVTKANNNFTVKVEPLTTVNATFSIPLNGWVIWGGVLYKALTNIIPGDQYVVDSNIKRFTMEEIIGHPEDLITLAKSNLVAAINEVLTTLNNTAGDLNDLNTTDKSNLVAAINEVLTTLNNIAGDLDDLNTTDKSNLVAAINEVLTTLNDTTGDLNDLNTTDKSNIVAAINEVLTTLADVAGDLNDLTTTDKSNLVAAINEIASSVYDLSQLHTIDKSSLVNAINDVLDYNYRALSSFTGSNDTEIFQNAIDGCDYLVLDRDITISTVEINNPIKINLNGHTITSNTVDTNTIDIISSDVEIFNGSIYTTVSNPNNARFYGSCILTKNYPTLIDPPKMKNIIIHDLYLSTNGGIFVSLCGECYNSKVYNIIFDGDRTNKSSLSIGLNMEWFGTPHVNTWHPHDIHVSNIVGHHLTDGLRTAAAFNITMENCLFYSIYKGTQSLGEGIEIAVGDWGNEAAQAEYKNSVNKNIIVRNVAVYSAPSGIHAMGHQYGNVECKVENFVFSTGDYNLGRGVFLQNCKNWDISDVDISSCSNGMLLNTCDNINVHNCKIHDVELYGMYVLNCTNMKLHENRIHNVNHAETSSINVTTAAVALSGCENGIISNNITGGGTDDNTRIDFYWTATTNFIVTDNLYDVGLSTTPASFIVDNNLQY